MKQKTPSAVFTLLLVFTAFLSIPACGRQSDKPKEVLTVQDFGSPVELVPIQSGNVANDRRLYGLTDCDEYLLAYTSGETHAIKLIRKSDFQVQDSICPLGEGPEEYLGLEICRYDYSTGNLFVLESDKSLLREINIDESVHAGSTVVKGERSYAKSGRRLWSLYVANSGRQLACTINDGSFSYYEIQPGKPIKEENLRSAPIELAESLKPNTPYITQSLSAFNPEKEVAFISYANMRRFDLVSVEKGLLNTLYFNEKKSANQTAEEMSEMYQWYPWGIASTKEHIYLGYALEERKSEEEELEQTHILVFDWEGNPVKHLVLPIPARSFTLSQDGKKLYTLNESETELNSTSAYDIK